MQSHLCVVNLCSLKETHPFNLTWARLFYLFGDGQAKSSLYSQLRADVSAGATIFNISEVNSYATFFLSH